MQYVVMKDEETNEIEVIGRFKEYGLGESFQNGSWEDDSLLIRLRFDGLLENISETQAMKLLSARKQDVKIAA